MYRHLAVVVVAVGFAGVCHEARAATPENRTWTFATGAEPAVAVSNIAGSIVVEARPGSEVAVQAQIVGGTEADRARWTVEARHDATGVVVRVCCGPCGAERGQCPSAVQVKLTVTAPGGSDTKTVNGFVKVLGRLFVPDVY